ncbi:hypothetical protein MHB48_10720 [Psychrobacillus sp. FSL H8-0483]|uniref:hypothetical protein n=1 Tax=Psychrobacillus sp. FSL H8-0483 TaxID=2921389 RepID=UPI00315B243C
MNVSFNTESFTIDEQNNQIEKIKNYLLIENKMEASLSDALNYSIKFTEANLNKNNLNLEEVKKMMFSYLITVFLSQISGDIEILPVHLSALERVKKKFNSEEVEEIASIYNNMLEDFELDNIEPMTIGKLIRFTNRSMPTIFLTCMGVENEEFINLNDNELADFILMKFQDKEFKEYADFCFNIKK